MKFFKNLLPAFALLFCFNFAAAQGTTAEKYENIKWYSILHIKWEDGKMEDAKKIINEYFIPSTQDVGQTLPVLAVDLLFGEWDLMVIFPMDEGLEVFEWKTSPMDAEWNSALLKRAGSEEKLKEIWEEFNSYVKESKTMLARNTN